MRHVVWGCIVLLSLQAAAAATISGTVYDLTLDDVEAIVEIDTVPVQKMVAKGAYSFDVPPGTYTLTALRLDTNETMQETVTIATDGAFVRDIIFFDTLDDLDFGTGNGFDDETQLPEIPQEEPSSSLWIVVLVLLALVALAWFLKKKPTTAVAKKPDKDLSAVMKFINSNKRTTQREIRKAFPMSEAKVSLILTELEEQGKIQKVKKGRGNIILKK